LNFTIRLHEHINEFFKERRVIIFGNPFSHLVLFKEYPFLVNLNNITGIVYSLKNFPIYEFAKKLPRRLSGTREKNQLTVDTLKMQEPFRMFDVSVENSNNIACLIFSTKIKFMGPSEVVSFLRVSKYILDLIRSWNYDFSSHRLKIVNIVSTSYTQPFSTIALTHFNSTRFSEHFKDFPGCFLLIEILKKMEKVEKEKRPLNYENEIIKAIQLFKRRKVDQNVIIDESIPTPWNDVPQSLIDIHIPTIIPYPYGKNIPIEENTIQLLSTPKKKMQNTANFLIFCTGSVILNGKLLLQDRLLILTIFLRYFLYFYLPNFSKMSKTDQRKYFIRQSKLILNKTIST